MSIWETLGKGGEPVSGQIHEFESLEQQFRSVRVHLAGAADELKSHVAAPRDEFQGDAAEAFRSKVSAIANALTQVPLIAAQVESVFRHHRTQLEVLKAEANSAVARAHANWRERGEAEDELIESTKNRDWIDRQIRWIDRHPDQDDERPYWTSRRIEAEDWHASARVRVRRADEGLDDSRREWHRLHDRENDLDRSTAASLKGVALWSLSDPSMWEQVSGAVADFYTGFKDFAGYIFSLDFVADYLEILRELLELVSFVLSIVSLLLIVVGLVLAPFGVGGFLLAGGLALMKLVTILEIVRLATTFGLAALDRKKWSEFGIEAVEAGASFAGGKVVGKIASPLSLGFLRGTSKSATIASLELQSAALDELAEGVGGGATAASINRSDWYSSPFRFETTEKFAAYEQGARTGAHLARVARHFDFDPPDIMIKRSSVPKTLRLVPTGW